MTAPAPSAPTLPVVNPFPPAIRRPRGIWREWVNTALRSRADADAAVAELTACGLAPHQDSPKNWDVLVALGEILDRCMRRDAVLEMGAASYSPLLSCLAQYGFTRLQGIDLVRTKTAHRGPVVLRHGDLTATTFRDHSFRAIACLSVVEHGVELRAYLAEAARLLRPGGVLITSTDFWCSDVDTAGKTAYGVPVRIFTPAEIEAFVALARELGFRTPRQPRLDCRDAVVRWNAVGLDYTFVNIVLTADPGSPRARVSTLAHRLRR